MLCNCIDCDKPATDKVLGFLLPVQKDMLGYFCSDCIKAGCINECRAVA